MMSGGGPGCWPHVSRDLNAAARALSCCLLSVFYSGIVFQFYFVFHDTDIYEEYGMMLL